MLKTIKAYRDSETKLRDFVKLVHGVQTLINIVLLVMMPIIVFALARTLEVEIPETPKTKAFVAFMTLVTHLSAYAIIAMDKNFDKKLIKRLIITELILFVFFPKFLVMFGAAQLISLLAATLVLLVVPGNMLILLGVIFSKVLTRYKNHKPTLDN